MLLPSTIFSKIKISESNLKLIIFSGFAMYFLVLYEMFPEYLFDEQYVLFTLVVPLVVVVVGLNIKKINLKNFSLKNISLKSISIKGKGNTKNSEIETQNQIEDADSEIAGNSEIDALLAGTGSENNSGTSEMEALLAKTEAEGKENGNSEIDAMLAKTEEGDKPEEGIGGNPEIEALLAGAETNEGDNYSDSSLDNSDTELIIMEKMEPIENDIQTLKTDFDQFKQDLTTVKEEVEILSNSFETTLTDIKLLTTDMNNPLNFMKEDAPFKENIQTINVDALVQKSEKSPDNIKPNSQKQEPVVQEPVVQEPVVQEPVVQEPVVQEPVVQEPVVQEPVVQEPVVQEPVVQEPVVQEPVVQEPVVQEPVVQEPVVQDAELPEDIISLVDELSRDFIPEEVFELTKVHCKTLNITIDEKQLKQFIDKKNNSNEPINENEEKSDMEKMLAKTIENEVK
ncbi:hypothetical protein [Nitrosopumilus adriaticus]|uniref:Uncharacterized protein n=1 Tax=Nitrosopumilus adriaticus TaxID=1580092 RepID=A0A0D5C275_9ARCH|nr:hypothetical protein [Nitrosopumilus adriaticus]AJW70507.1 hypothetical protein NADRNF5_0813 [Nitrosopumilus adriaticus]